MIWAYRWGFSKFDGPNLQFSLGCLKPRKGGWPPIPPRTMVFVHQRRRDGVFEHHDNNGKFYMGNLMCAWHTILCFTKLAHNSLFN
jgi:hypothetical protein